MESDVQLRELQKQNLVAEVLRTSGTVKLTARGHSMMPTLWPGDFLNIETVSFDRVQVGDLVLYERSNRFFIHRVLQKSAGVESRRPTLVTRGDSMLTLDPMVRPEELLGRVVSLERRSKGRVPIPDCSVLRRAFGMVLGYSDRLRSFALRIHAWRQPRNGAQSAVPEVQAN
jgi:hypothetical protein